MTCLVTLPERRGTGDVSGIPERASGTSGGAALELRTSTESSQASSPLLLAFRFSLALHRSMRPNVFNKRGSLISNKVTSKEEKQR